MDRIVDPNILRKTLNSESNRGLLYDHFDFKKHGRILDPEIYPNLKLVLLYRHPVDAFISLFYRRRIENALIKPKLTPIENFKFQIRKQSKIGKRNVLRKHVYRFAVGWKRHRSCLPVRYEDLIGDTESELKKILDYLIVSAADEKVREAIVKYSFENLSGGRKPGEIDEYDHYRLGIPGEWKTLLDREDVRILQDIMGDYLEELGYSLDEREIRTEEHRLSGSLHPTKIKRIKLIDWNKDEILRRVEVNCYGDPLQARSEEIFIDKKRHLVFNSCTPPDHIATPFIDPIWNGGDGKYTIVISYKFPKHKGKRVTLIQLQNSRCNIITQIFPNQKKAEEYTFEVEVSKSSHKIRLVFINKEINSTVLPSKIKIEEIIRSESLLGHRGLNLLLTRRMP